jgi:hypothetical protein
MMDYVAYFDTSGSETDTDSMLVTVGAISTVKKWERFDKRWLALMKKYGVRSFRLSDFENSSGDFAGWKGDEDTRTQFIAELIDAMNKGINKVLIKSLVLPDYNEFNARYKLTETVGGPYSLVQATTLLESLRWLTEKKDAVRDTFRPVVERGDNGQKAFKRFLRKHGPIEVTYTGKIDPLTGEPFTPLNACDLIAGHHRRVYVEALEARRLKPITLWPKTLVEIRKKIPIHATMIEAKFLKHFCETMKIDRR